MSDVKTSCKYCGSSDVVIRTDLIGVHWGSIDCTICNRNLRWLPNPVVKVQYEERQNLIQQALESNRLTSWERFFLKGIHESRWLSPKQQQKFDQIIQRHSIKIPAFRGAGSG